jgi:small GTP-binding protein
MKETKDVLKKMCVIGDEAVGKTSLIRRFVVDKFDDKYIVTIGTKTSKKNLTIKGTDANVNLKLMIWDILGQQKFDELKRSAFKGASGAFIVLDLTRRETLDSFNHWLTSLFNVVGEVPVVILANKKDLKGKFGKDEIEKLVGEHGFPYYFTSAKTGEKVNEAFYNLGRMMLKQTMLQKKKPKKDISDEIQWDLESIPDKKLTPLEIEDMIMTRFCNLLEDQEYAMAIIRKQFKRADVDFKSPTIEGLTKLVDYLIYAASDQVESNRLEKERRAYMNLIRRAG